MDLSLNSGMIEWLLIFSDSFCFARACYCPLYNSLPAFRGSELRTFLCLPNFGISPLIVFNFSPGLLSPVPTPPSFRLRLRSFHPADLLLVALRMWSEREAEADSIRAPAAAKTRVSFRNRDEPLTMGEVRATFHSIEDAETRRLDFFGPSRCYCILSGR